MKTLLALAAIFVTHAALAQTAYASAPIKMVVPFAAGGTGDVVARILGERAGAELGQSIVVDNRTGAGGTIGAQAVAKSKPDGYTLLTMATAHVILAHLQKDIPYSVERDFVPVFGVNASPLAFAVQAKSSFRSFADLGATAKTVPGGLSYASGGVGSISHLASVRLIQEMKVSGVHVPFRGFSGAVQALLGNQLHFICAGVADVLEHVRSGEFRLLAVTAEQRLASLPDVPTMIELGFADFAPASWNAILAPAGTPREVVDRLRAYP